MLLVLMATLNINTLILLVIYSWGCLVVMQLSSWNEIHWGMVLSVIVIYNSKVDTALCLSDVFRERLC